MYELRDWFVKIETTNVVYRAVHHNKTNAFWMSIPEQDIYDNHADLANIIDWEVFDIYSN